MIVDELARIEGGPWAEWGKGGKPITQNALARLLKPLSDRRRPRAREAQRLQACAVRALVKPNPIGG